MASYPIRDSADLGFSLVVTTCAERVPASRAVVTVATLRCRGRSHRVASELAGSDAKHATVAWLVP